MQSQQRDSLVQSWRQVPLRWGAAEADDTDCATNEGTSSSVTVPANDDKPVPPPAHVIAQVFAWQKQEQVYRGAACPCVASDDPELSLSGLTEMVGHHKPIHGASDRNLLQLAQAPTDHDSKLPAADCLSHRDIARRSLLRHCSRISQAFMHLESGRPQSPPAAILYGSPSCQSTYRSPNLDRVAGGGTGLPATLRHPGFGPASVKQHETISGPTGKIEPVAGNSGPLTPAQPARPVPVPR